MTQVGREGLSAEGGLDLGRSSGDEVLESQELLTDREGVCKLTGERRETPGFPPSPCGAILPGTIPLPQSGDAEFVELMRCPSEGLG